MERVHHISGKMNKKRYTQIHDHVIVEGKEKTKNV